LNKIKKGSIYGKKSNSIDALDMNGMLEAELDIEYVINFILKTKE